MSGDADLTERVLLAGPVMVRLVGAIPRVQEILGTPVIVGGLAVMSRLGRAHRATQDLDALRRRAEGQPSGLEVLEAAGAVDMNEVGGFLETARGTVRVDVLDAGPHDLDRQFSDPTDRLEATAHRWALDTATFMRIEANSIDETRAVETVLAEVLVARPGPLVAMKLKASVDRGAAKQATDLLDVVRLVTDPVASRHVAREFTAVDAQVRTDVAHHAAQQFFDRRPQTRRMIRNLNVAGIDDTLVDAAGEFLAGLLGIEEDE